MAVAPVKAIFLQHKTRQGWGGKFKPGVFFKYRVCIFQLCSHYILCAVESVWEQSKNIGKQDSRKLLAQWFGSDVRCIVTLFGFCIRKHGVWKEGFGSGEIWNNLKNQFSVVIDTIKCKRNKIRHQKEHSQAQTLLCCAHILHIILVIDQLNTQNLVL